MAGSVHQARSVPVRHATSAVVVEVVGGDRPLDDAQPPAFPLDGRLRRLIRDEQMLPTERAAPVLLGEQAQVVAVQRGRHLAPPLDPVVDQVGIIRRCPASDQLMSNDRRPGELDQVSDVPAIIYGMVPGSRAPNTQRSFLNLLNRSK
jgi:hypothetical protein